MFLVALLPKTRYKYRKEACSNKRSFLEKLIEMAADLPAFVSREELQEADFVPVNSIKAVAVWDTVGSLGIPNYLADSRNDTFRFTDTTLSPKVENGFHAVARDELRWILARHYGINRTALNRCFFVAPTQI